MDLHLNDKIVLITGGSKGLGLASIALPRRAAIFTLSPAHKRRWTRRPTPFAGNFP